MNDKGLVSIIVPVYNREALLEECVNSVFSQTYQNFEIILIDDGSTDNTLKLCHGLTEKDRRIKLLTQQHGGVSNARNVGLDAAQGEFVFFLDSDDVIHPILLEALVSSLNETNAGMAGTDVAHANEKNWHRVLEACKKQGSKEYAYHSFEESIHAVFHDKTPFGCIGGVMMRRDLIRDTRFNPHFFIGEDFLFIYENLIKETGTVFLNKKLYYVRNHENNSSWDWNYSGFLNRFERREWVWKSEERFGRIENANNQKRAVLGFFKVCVGKHKPYDEESRKMRKLMRKNKKFLLPAFNVFGKIKFYISVYFPFLSSLYIKMDKAREAKK